MFLDNYMYNLDFWTFFFRATRLVFWKPYPTSLGPKGSLEFFLEHSLDLCSCSLFYTNNYFFCSCYQAWLLGTLAYKFGCPKGSLEFILEQSLNHCSCSLFYTNHGTPNFYFWTLSLRLRESLGVQRTPTGKIVGKTLDLYFKSCDILRQHLLGNSWQT